MKGWWVNASEVVARLEGESVVVWEADPGVGRGLSWLSRLPSGACFVTGLFGLLLQAAERWQSE
jgi:hypothetical protein